MFRKIQELTRKFAEREGRSTRKNTQEKGRFNGCFVNLFQSLYNCTRSTIILSIVQIILSNNSWPEENIMEGEGRFNS